MSQHVTAWRIQLRRVALAIGGSTAIVMLVAALVPRAYLVNDDPGFVLYLRLGAFTPWISPVLNQALGASYQMAPDVPWYGLFLYGMIIACGAVLIHTCIELLDARRGLGRIATWLGAIMLIASHIILAIGITWTTVSISAVGTATVAFVAHLQTCQATGVPASRLRAVILGLLFVAGFALRDAAIFAAAAALLPFLGWILIRLVQSRHLPRPTAVLAFLAPFVLLVAIQNRIPQPPGAEHEEFNAVRGRISDAATFRDLDKRAPELLERAGWTLDEYRDFSNWLLADDTEFTVDKVRRLADTGGVPTSIGIAKSFRVLLEIASDSAASIFLFLTMIAGGLLLAWLGVVDRRRAVLVSLGYLAFLSIVPVAMAALSRFPQRLSLSFYTVAAFAMFVFLAGEIASRPPRTESSRRPLIAAVVISLFVLAWGRNLVAWTHRDSWPYHTTLRAFADRVKARNGIIMVAVGVIEMDPLLADPRGYDALPSGWGTFTGAWYQYIERFGIRSGSEFLHNLIDNPNAYLIAMPYGHATFEEWIRRRLNKPTIRLSLVDSAAGMPTAIRSELYRLVTTPLVRGSEEWELLARNQTVLHNELPGPPDVSDRAFRSITFDAPYEEHASPFVRPANGIVVAPIDRGVRCTVRGASDPCTDPGEGGDHAGIRIPVNGLHAARFAVTLINPENVVGFHVYARTASDRSVRWRWELDPAAQQFGFSGTITLVPGSPAHQLRLVDNTATARSIRELHVLIEVKPGTHAGFDLRDVQVAEP